MMDKQAFDLMMARFDRIEEGQEKLHSTFSTNFEDHSSRINVLEKKDVHRTGVMIGGGAVITFLSGIVSWIMK